jgi:hypothetical protein
MQISLNEERKNIGNDVESSKHQPGVDWQNERSLVLFLRMRMIAVPYKLSSQCDLHLSLHPNFQFATHSISVYSKAKSNNHMASVSLLTLTYSHKV